MEKEYDERTGSLVNRRSMVVRMLSRLRLEETEVEPRELLHKDSLDLTDADRGLIVASVRSVLDEPERPGVSARGVVIVHGTDTLHLTGELLAAEIPSPRWPVILTGAMRPFELQRSDAMQNLTESIFAAGVLAPGIYAVAHGRALAFPGVRKDRDRGTFVRV